MIKSMQKTKIIDNFRGSLTRILNGDLNSGFAKFSSSWGYDPFSKPMNLTWLEKETDLDPNASVITDLLLAAKVRVESQIPYVYAIGNSANFYKIQASGFIGSIGSPNVDTPVLLSNLSALSPAPDFTYGSSIEFYGSAPHVYISSKQQISVVNTNGTGTGTVFTDATFTGLAVPLKQFQGKLYFGNGNNIGEIDSTETVTTYTKLSPALPSGFFVKDLDVTPDGNYLLISGNFVSAEQFGPNADIQQTGSDSFVFRWNGIDTGITAYTQYPSTQITANQSTLNAEITFGADITGTFVSSNGNKELTLPNNKSPYLNATISTNNFITWFAPEIVSGTSAVASLYYYGALDSEVKKGLWRLLRSSPATTNGYIYDVPINIITNNYYRVANQTGNAVVTGGYGKHYFSTYDYNGSVTKYKLYRFLTTPTGSGIPTLGTYETQTEIFSNKVTIRQIRVYTDPTVTGNAFQISVIGNDNTAITNGVKSYSFSAGSDPTLLQGSFDRVDFDCEIAPTYAVGIKIDQTGTTNMNIKKIEIDYEIGGN